MGLYAVVIGAGRYSHNSLYSLGSANTSEERVIAVEKKKLAQNIMEEGKKNRWKVFLTGAMVHSNTVRSCAVSWQADQTRQVERVDRNHVRVECQTGQPESRAVS